MTWRFLTTGSMAAAELALTCLIQSSVLIGLRPVRRSIGEAVGAGGPVSALSDDAGGRPALSLRIDAVDRGGIQRPDDPIAEPHGDRGCCRRDVRRRHAAGDRRRGIGRPNQQDRSLDERAEIFESVTSSPAAMAPQGGRVGEPRSPAGSPRTLRPATVPAPSAWSRGEPTKALAWGVCSAWRFGCWVRPRWGRGCSSVTGAWSGFAPRRSRPIRARRQSAVRSPSGCA